MVGFFNPTDGRDYILYFGSLVARWSPVIADKVQEI